MKIWSNLNRNIKVLIAIWYIAYKRLIQTMRLLDEKIVVEGLFTIVLYAEGRVEDNKPHKYFRTQGLGYDTCKSPRGMFEEMEIPNDLNYVLTKIKEYNEGE